MATHEPPAPRESQKSSQPHQPHESRVALVTGAARGIGAATVVTLAEAGWRVLAVDCVTDDPNLPYKLGTRTELEQVATDAGPNVVTARAGAAAEARWGHLDAALAVAGVIAGGVPAWEVPIGREQAVLDIDLGGVINLARVAVPALLRHPEPRHGRFLAVASAAATRGLPMLAAYCAAKAGVAGFIRALAVELGGSGVTANAVSPGSTDTAILGESARLYDLAEARSFAAQQPLGRLIEPPEVAVVLAFLASPASNALTGAIIPVDGGLAL